MLFHLNNPTLIYTSNFLAIRIITGSRVYLLAVASRETSTIRERLPLAGTRPELLSSPVDGCRFVGVTILSAASYGSRGCCWRIMANIFEAIGGCRGTRLTKPVCEFDGSRHLEGRITGNCEKHQREAVTRRKNRDADAKGVCRLLETIVPEVIELVRIVHLVDVGLYLWECCF